MLNNYKLSDYLLDVVNYMGANDIFGVPGDYNLQFLDHITHRSDLNWTGNANELNASYMADGYAREKGFATFVTTFGVGELSAINGLSGSIAEHVPVLEIVGAPTNNVQNNGSLVHHTFGDHKFDRFEKAHRQLGIKAVKLNSEHAIDQINDVAKYIYETKKPAYIILPTNLVEMEVNQSLKNDIPSLFINKEINSDKAFNQIKSSINNSEKPVIIMGHEVDRFNVFDDIKAFSSNNNIPILDLGLGKGNIDESFANFVGTYNGQISDESVNKYVENADTVILIGAKLTDSVTGGFTQQFNEQNTIVLNYENANIYGKSVDEDYDFKTIMSYLSNAKLDLSLPEIKDENDKLEVKSSNNKLTQSFYDNAVRQFTSDNNTIVAEQGTSFFGLASQRLPEGAKFFGQPLWGSIGYAFPAALGNQIANKDRRVVLSTGEGSLQLTIQELGLAFREKLNPVMFVIDNSGYTVERVIHGMNEHYNDVPKLNYGLMPKAFGAKDDEYDFIEASTENELIDAMSKAKEEKDKLVLIQVNMGMKDVPEQLAKTAKAFADQNK
ncbi:alpha-keto acid decarboxylase family protein [Apilactobacillus micheneri]|uniref:Alpha-keto-acid decarboxylase n=1 Tax=Apilactobacillus micheneri TaxID=1899430 RepID=A0A9Q8INK9_9LACO|nr:thiamine pyrophosphate-binding protein [Apilactobacillus micheneri]TPR40031.1 alpha-keto acid decarboxylase family protein [Apilactobacillus micheneri]TPR41842.1 alpha-keto acid decarboxylase family protein [Apilactobacillus micheneri]TPR44233.1 alpha-keto acid decarboxylase family protein [Apilactobacillus micheneri]TPR45857.1 alpha-keto acid decarboxylase family protein [Apilactobacillus micheneri]TPR50601.1 alpha-keto acid decarboxylase family protein [Apilactobacillus micheneri]